MAQLHIDTNACKGCGLCVKTCANQALSLVDKVAVVGDNCTLCGICTCPFGAISIEKEAHTVAQSQNLWVFVEVQQGAIAPVSLELLGIGAALAQEKDCALVAVVLDEGGDALTQTLIAHGAHQVLLCPEPGLSAIQQPRCATILQEMIGQYHPEILLIGATGFGRSLAPTVASAVQTGLTADCTVLAIDPATGLLRQTRPAFGGNLMATIVCPAHRPQMSTVRPGVMTLPTPDDSRTGQVITFTPATIPGPSGVEILSTTLAHRADSITDAQILVVVGRGIGGKKNMKLVAAFAEKIGAKVAVSRPLVDMGYAPYAQQVGQTGCTVAPQLLISLGVSGAIQHKAGISRAQTIVAINSDPDAPIFAISQYKIVADCLEFLKEYVKIT